MLTFQILKNDLYSYKLILKLNTLDIEWDIFEIPTIKKCKNPSYIFIQIENIVYLKV